MGGFGAEEAGAEVESWRGGVGVGIWIGVGGAVGGMRSVG